MEPPQPGLAGSPPVPSPLRPVRRPNPRLPVRSRADGRLVITAVAVGACFDLAVHSGVATIASTVLVLVAAAALLLGGRIRGRTSKVMIVAAALFGLTFTFRASPWVIIPAAVAVAVLLLIGTSLGADGGGLAGTFPALGSRVAVVFGHLIYAPGMFYYTGASAQETNARKWGAGVLRGVLIGVPIMLIIGLLLASADPIFRSWFDPTLVLQHLLLLLIGAWLIVGLARAATAERPLPGLRVAPSLGMLEAAIVLGGMCALYAAFVAAQFVALSGVGHRILVTQGLTYAEYARSGFFRLLICAAITLLVLLSVRACANPANPVLIGLSLLTVILTIGVVIVAFRRLQLYEAAFGLTMLRLACFAVAVWIGVVFVLLGSTMTRRGLTRRQFPAAFIASGLLLIAIWIIANPVALVARTNLHRAGQGGRLDISQAMTLGPDAMPALLAGLKQLPSSQMRALRPVLCSSSSGQYGGTSFNLARFIASNALIRSCG